jgi:two-component system KDP operon response regulator KdpE
MAILGVNGAGKTTFEIGDLKVDLATRRVFVSEAEVHLTPLEYKLVVTMVQNAGKVLTHRQLLEKVWGPHQVRETWWESDRLSGQRRSMQLARRC